MKSSSRFATRRALLKSVPGAFLLGSLPASVFAQPSDKRTFVPQPGNWRTFEVSTRIDLTKAGPSTVVVPIPSVSTDWQRSFSSNWAGNAKSAHIETDPHYGAQYVVATFDGSAPPMLEVTSLVKTQNRATDWSKPTSALPAEDLRLWLKPTDLMPLDGIVKVTARQITEGARTDIEKVKRIYDWVIVTTYREPKVRGCGVGDVKAMLENKSFGGKCGDINGLFVALCRAAGVPARDAYGIRLAPSAFGYAQLGGKSASLTGAQHCRAEVWLKGYGWVPMDPADVGKVMRMETGEWIKDADHPLVAPVRKGLFGGWEGNWMAYNFAHDVKLPAKALGKVAFLMYPQAETRGEAYDSLAADDFKYSISAREIPA
ncbi:MAG: transglutaminase domain-containing protein [Rhodocyclaceae bacterium]|nr:transglutaminase domain-containing protein [Rhodocyclaceae bacterium]